MRALCLDDKNEDDEGDQEAEKIQKEIMSWH